MRSPRAPRATEPPRVEADLVRRLTPESQVPLLVNISSLRGSAPTRFRRPGYTAARQTSGRRLRSPAISGVAASPLIRAGTQAARRVCGARSSVRALAREGAHFLVPPPPPPISPHLLKRKEPAFPCGNAAPHEPMIRRPSLLAPFPLARSPCFLLAWGLTSCVCGLGTRWRRWRRKSARNRSSSSP